MGDVAYIEDYVEKSNKIKISGLEDSVRNAFYDENLEKMVHFGAELHKVDPNNPLAFAAFAASRHGIHPAGKGLASGKIDIGHLPC